MSEIVTDKLSIDTTGGAGSATGSGTTPLMMGYLESIRLDYHASAPVTTDLTLVDNSTGETLLTLSNTVTDVTVPLRQQMKDSTGTAITGAYDRVPLAGTLTINLAQCDALTAAVVVYIKYLRIT